MLTNPHKRKRDTDSGTDTGETYEPSFKSYVDQLNINKTVLDMSGISHINDIANKLVLLYREIFMLIDRACNKAKAENKRLMILVGEDHESLNSHIVEILIYIIANHYFGIDTLLDETDEIGYEIKKNKRRINECLVFNDAVWNKSMSLYDFVEALGGKIIPIDLGTAGGKKISDGVYEQLKRPEFHVSSDGSVYQFNGRSLEGIQYRNKVMHEVANLRAEHNVIAKVGADHLHGLLCETKLKDDFHVVTIDATGISFEFKKNRIKALKVLGPIGALLGHMSHQDLDEQLSSKKYSGCDLYPSVLPGILPNNFTPNYCNILVKHIHGCIEKAAKTETPQAVSTSTHDISSLALQADSEKTDPKQKAITYLYDRIDSPPSGMFQDHDISDDESNEPDEKEKNDCRLM